MTTRRSITLAAVVACFVLCGTRTVVAQGENAAQPEPAAAAAQVQHAEHVAVAAAHPGAAPVVAAHAEHEGAGAHQGEAAHHEEEDDISFDNINWAYGLLGESDDPAPSLLFRPKGMPAPFLATLINWLILVWLIVLLAKKQLPAALKKRKANLVSGMEEAARVKAQAQDRLGELETKLSHIDEEISRIKAEMQRTSELERERVLREAEERRTRMERDATRLIETELEGAKEQLRRDVVQAALRQATDEVTRQLTNSDQDRLFDEALGSLKGLPNKSLGGRA